MVWRAGRRFQFLPPQVAHERATKPGHRNFVCFNIVWVMWRFLEVRDSGLTPDAPFQGPLHRHHRHPLDPARFHHFLRQQAQRPALAPWWGLGAGQCGQASLERPVEDDFSRRQCTPLALQGQLQPLLHKPPLQALNRTGGDSQRLGHPGYGLSWPFRPPVAQKQCPRVQEPLGGGLDRGPGQCRQFRAFLRCERDTIALCQENPSFRVLQPSTVVYDQLHVMGY